MRPPSARLKSEKIPLWSIIMLTAAGVSGVILVIARYNSAFAAFFNTYISGAVRFVLSFITSYIPFSVAELIIIFLPILITLLIIYAVKNHSQSIRAVLSYFTILLSCVSMIFTIFVFSFGVGYHVPTLYEQFNIPENGITATELQTTAEKLVTEINRRVNEINYDINGASVMPYSVSEMNKKLISAYKKLNSDFNCVQSFSSNIKPVFMSVPMSYTHTTGVYTFFTGEANLNVDFPDYTLPYTAAHELAHQRGISRENEANFIAFLAAINSDDTYIEYSAYLNMFEYVASALYSADADMYKSVYALLSEQAKSEIAAYSSFYEKYRNSKVGEISQTINNAYLIVNGNPEGTQSYGLVVDLAVAYFNGYFDN